MRNQTLDLTVHSKYQIYQHMETEWKLTWAKGKRGLIYGTASFSTYWAECGSHKSYFPFW